jgi:GT2 family glycosyltransferase
VTRFGVVVLSRGDRPSELARCLSSVQAQEGVDLDVVVVGNGWAPSGLPAGVRSVHLPDNLGSPAGRNVGVAAVEGDYVFFFDDDAWTDDVRLLSAWQARFESEGRLGAVVARIVSPDGQTLRRWVPRARVGDPAVSGPAFNILEGVVAVRRSAFEEVGGWAADFFHGHEGIDLTWRLWDAGWQVAYDAGAVVHHPASAPGRHAVYLRLNARNKVWVARRNLPWLLVPVYLGVWTAISVARLVRDPASLRTWLRGFAEGWRTSPGPRRPMQWRTVARLTRLGQPPVI